MEDLRNDEDVRNFLNSVLDGVAFQIQVLPRANANRSLAARRSSYGNDVASEEYLKFNARNRRNHPYNRRGFTYGRRESRTDVNIEGNCKNIIDLLRRFQLNITSIKDLISQQIELMKLASECQARPAS